MPPKLLDYERIKQKIANLGLAIPGTLRETYLLCGKAGCACAEKNAAKHGPYYLWNRKVNGKLTSKSVPKGKLSLCQEWLDNRRVLEELVQEMLEIGSELAIVMLQQEVVGNSKRLASSKRGK